MNWLRSSVAYEFMPDGVLIESDGGHKKKTFPLIWHGPLQSNTDMGASLICAAKWASVSVCVWSIMFSYVCVDVMQLYCTNIWPSWKLVWSYFWQIERVNQKEAWWVWTKNKLNHLYLAALKRKKKKRVPNIAFISGQKPCCRLCVWVCVYA